jgi:hypothetical protein
MQACNRGWEFDVDFPLQVNDPYDGIEGVEGNGGGQLGDNVAEEGTYNHNT